MRMEVPLAMMAKNLFKISKNSQKKTMITMIFQDCGHACNHENHNNLGNHGQKNANSEIINRF